ncbi:hypothetical protein SteCoe_25301 [Stentor coeruleus]|uniref:Uncharacterized protein n=1 Tax=Stentor coeruleus TaxID=5963 RepID=A0A1R2BFH7_9CILI|nr:hypothetical protein SteCoe_25301 [Stentor coeruleus]
MLKILFRLLALVLLSSGESLDNFKTTEYFMVTRSITLYLLILWFTFMYICIVRTIKYNPKSIIFNNGLTNRLSNRDSAVQ